MPCPSDGCGAHRGRPPRECTPQVVQGRDCFRRRRWWTIPATTSRQVLTTWPRICCEMEGAGAAAAIEQGEAREFQQDSDDPGDLDLPRAKGKNKGRKERMLEGLRI